MLATVERRCQRGGQEQHDVHPVAVLKALERNWRYRGVNRHGRGVERTVGQWSGGGSASYILKILPGFESDGPTGGDADLFTGPGVSANAALSWLHLKHAEAAQLDSLAPLHGEPHRVEDRIDSHLSFDLGDVGYFRHLVDDVDFDHAWALLEKRN